MQHLSDIIGRAAQFGSENSDLTNIQSLQAILDTYRTYIAGIVRVEIFRILFTQASHSELNDTVNGWATLQNRHNPEMFNFSPAELNFLLRPGLYGLDDATAIMESIEDKMSRIGMET